MTSNRLIKPEKVRLCLSFHQHNTVPQKEGINIFLPFYHRGVGLILAFTISHHPDDHISSLTFVLFTAARVLSEWGATTPRSADGTCTDLFVSPNYLWNNRENMWCKQTRHRNDHRKRRNVRRGVEEFLEHISNPFRNETLMIQYKQRKGVLENCN